MSQCACNCGTDCDSPCPDCKPDHAWDRIDQPGTPEALNQYLKWFSRSALEQYKSIEMGFKEPVLFATYRGRRVRVVMSSRFGDLGITTDLTAKRGYSERVPISDLTDFSEEP